MTFLSHWESKNYNNGNQGAMSYHRPDKSDGSVYTGNDGRGIGISDQKGHIISSCLNHTIVTVPSNKWSSGCDDSPPRRFDHHLTQIDTGRLDML